MSSWADEIDETDSTSILPPPSEKWVGNSKITTEYSHNEEGKKVSTLLSIALQTKINRVLLILVVPLFIYGILCDMK